MALMMVSSNCSYQGRSVSGHNEVVRTRKSGVNLTSLRANGE